MVEYDPDDFTLAGYHQLLQLAKNNFVFKKYTDNAIKESEQRVVIWRHDVDLSLDQALILSKIELEYNVKSTYFLHLHNDFYNLLDDHSYKLVNGILSNGHSLGLHFDLGYYNICSVKELEHWLNFEKNIIENLFKSKIEVFSFHNTNDQSAAFDDIKYVGMINCYSSFFKDEISYCSDSNGYWRFRKLSEVLNDSEIKKLQVLTHPGWWVEEKILPRDKIINYAEERRVRTIGNYDKTLEVTGRVNLG